VHATDPSPVSPHAGPPDCLAAWLRLEQTPGVGLKGAHALLAVFGAPPAVFAATGAAVHAALSGVLAPALLADAVRAVLAPAPAVLGAHAALHDATAAWLAAPDRAVCTFGDAAYPARLRELPDPPLLLYVQGRADLLAQPALAIVGSRNASAQGMANAERFGAALSQAGLTIVSGLALGIDAAAHRGGLHGAGATVAVIGTGPDRCYPARNAELARRIAGDGCIVSEYALGTPPLAANFPRRNRLISGLARGVLVVEAAAQSGSLLTAQFALEQGRDVFAIPGSIHAALSKGCHSLIKQGAQLVETADDVLGALCWHGPAAAPPARADAGARLLTELETLLVALGHDPAAADALALRVGRAPADVQGQLLALELAGMVERLPGDRFQRVYGQ